MMMQGNAPFLEVQNAQAPAVVAASLWHPPKLTHAQYLSELPCCLAAQLDTPALQSSRRDAARSSELRSFHVILLSRGTVLGALQKQ